MTEKRCLCRSAVYDANPDCPFHSPSPEEREQERVPPENRIYADWATTHRIEKHDEGNPHPDCPICATPPQDDAPETSERVEPETWWATFCGDCGFPLGFGEYRSRCPRCAAGRERHRHREIVPAKERERRQRAEELAAERLERAKIAEEAYQRALADKRAIITTAEAAEAEARTERERREEAERERDRAHHEAMQGHHAISECANHHFTRAEVDELVESWKARLSTAQDALREIAGLNLECACDDADEGHVCDLHDPDGEWLQIRARQALSNPTPSERKGHHPEDGAS